MAGTERQLYMPGDEDQELMQQDRGAAAFATRMMEAAEKAGCNIVTHTVNRAPAVEPTPTEDRRIGITVLPGDLLDCYGERMM